MRNGKLNDIVTCSRIGDGDFKVIDFREGVCREVRIQNLKRPMDTHWIYEHHCDKQLGKTLAAREMTATKILSKVRHG